MRHEQAGVSVTDSGFLYGAGLFETMRSRNGVVFRLQDHLDRLFLSAATLSITHSYDKPYIAEAIDQVAPSQRTEGRTSEADPDRRSPGGIGGTAKADAADHGDGVPALSRPTTTGQACWSCCARSGRITTDPTCGHKTTSYYPRLLALNLAHQRRAAEALWFTTDNRLAEGCVSNVFLVKNSILHTPPAQTPVLPGIARKTVLQLARQQSIEVVEKDLFIADLLEADEVFLTNVIMEVLPVVNVERHTVGDGKVGPVTQRLREAFRRRAIEQECGRQE